MTHAQRRAAMHEACTAVGVWSEALLGDEFLDGLVSLAVRCEELSVSDAALAGAAADSSAGISVVARALLAERGLGRRPSVAEPSSFARALQGDRLPTPVDLLDFAAALGVDAEALRPAHVAQPHSADAGTYETPWDWPSPEIPSAIMTPGMTFSASRLNAFVKCPRRWYFEYLCEAIEDPGSVQATYGKVFHEALEALHQKIRVPSEISENALFESLRRELETAFAAARVRFANALEYEVCRRKALAVARQYASWLARESRARPVEVRDVEVLQRWSHGGQLFVGYIDRIDRPLAGGPVTIYDYKTGRVEDDPAVYLSRIRSGHEAQLALYWAMRRAAGDTIGRMALISIRDPRDPVWLMAIDVVDARGDDKPELRPVVEDGIVRLACTPADLDAAVDVLVARARYLSSEGLQHFSPGDDPPCAHCAYLLACRERPIPPERIFAR